MIQHLHSLLCGRVIIDKISGLASYIDNIEGIILKTDSKPYKLPNFSLVSKFWVNDGIKDDQVLEIKVSIKKSSKSKWKELQLMKFNLDKKGDNILIDLKVENLTLEESGLWEFEVKWKIKDDGRWKKGTLIPLKVSTEKEK